MKCISVYVTDEQYEFLKSLKKMKVSMSAFVRGLIHLHMYSIQMRGVEVRESMETLVVKKRRNVKVKGFSKLHRELMKELKEVLKNRRVE